MNNKYGNQFSFYLTVFLLILIVGRNLRIDFSRQNRQLIIKKQIVYLTKIFIYKPTKINKHLVCIKKTKFVQRKLMFLIVCFRVRYTIECKQIRRNTNKSL